MSSGRQAAPNQAASIDRLLNDIRSLKIGNKPVATPVINQQPGVMIASPILSPSSSQPTPLPPMLTRSDDDAKRTTNFTSSQTCALTHPTSTSQPLVASTIARLVQTASKLEPSLDASSKPQVMEAADASKPCPLDTATNVAPVSDSSLTQPPKDTQIQITSPTNPIEVCQTETEAPSKLPPLPPAVTDEHKSSNVESQALTPTSLESERDPCDGPFRAPPPPPPPVEFALFVESRASTQSDEPQMSKPSSSSITTSSESTVESASSEPGEGPGRAPPPPPPPPPPASSLSFSSSLQHDDTNNSAQPLEVCHDNEIMDGPSKTAPPPPPPPSSSLESTLNRVTASPTSTNSDGEGPAFAYDALDGPRKSAPPPPPVFVSIDTTSALSISNTKEDNLAIGSFNESQTDDGPTKSAPPLPPSSSSSSSSQPVIASSEIREVPIEAETENKTSGNQEEDEEEEEEDIPILVRGGSDDDEAPNVPTRHSSLALPEASQVFRARVASLSQKPTAAEISASGAALCSVEGCTLPAGPQRQCLTHFVQSTKATWGAKEKSAAQEARRQSTLRGTLFPGGRAPQSLEALLEAVSGMSANVSTPAPVPEESTAGENIHHSDSDLANITELDDDAFAEQLSRHYANARASVVDNGPIEGLDLQSYYDSIAGDEDDEDADVDGEIDATSSLRLHRPPSHADIASNVGASEVGSLTSAQELTAATPASDLRTIFPSPTAAIVKSSFPTYVSSSAYHRSMVPPSVKMGMPSSSNQSEGQAALYLRGGSRQHTSSIVDAVLPSSLQRNAGSPMPMVVGQYRTTSPSVQQPGSCPSSPRVGPNSSTRAEIESALMSRAPSSRSTYSPLSEYDPEWQRQAMAHATDRQAPRQGTASVGGSPVFASRNIAVSTVPGIANESNSQLGNIEFATNIATGPEASVITRYGSRQRLIAGSLNEPTRAPGSTQQSPYERWRIAYAVSRARQTVAWTTFVQGTGLRHAGLEYEEIPDVRVPSAGSSSTGQTPSSPSKANAPHPATTVLSHPIAGVIALQERIQSKKGLQLVRDGIPIRARPIAWMSLLQAYEMQAQHSDYYATCIVQLAFQTTRSHKDIVKDVKRTMQYHPLFQSEEGTARLTNILGAFSFKNPRIGYCQSMNIITATLMLFYAEEETFWMLDALVEKIVPTYYAPTMIGVRADLAVFDALVERRLPQLARHFAQHSVYLNAVCVSWFMCLYVEVLPLETALRVWDVMIAEQSCAVLFRVGLAILTLASKDLLQAQSGGDIISFLSKFPLRLHDCDVLLKLAHERSCFVSQKDVEKLRGPILKALEEEHISTAVFLNHGR